MVMVMVMLAMAMTVTMPCNHDDATIESVGGGSGYDGVACDGGGISHKPSMYCRAKDPKPQTHCINGKHCTLNPCGSLQQKIIRDGVLFAVLSGKTPAQHQMPKRPQN